MADNVITMPGLASAAGHIPIQDEVIAILEGLLEDAKTGRLVAMAYVAVSQDGLIKSGWEGEISREILGYGLGKLTHKYYAACLDDD